MDRRHDWQHDKGHAGGQASLEVVRCTLAGYEDPAGKGADYCDSVLVLERPGKGETGRPLLHGDVYGDLSRRPLKLFSIPRAGAHLYTIAPDKVEDLGCWRLARSDGEALGLSRNAGMCCCDYSGGEAVVFEPRRPLWRRLVSCLARDELVCLRMLLGGRSVGELRRCGDKALQETQRGAGLAVRSCWELKFRPGLAAAQRERLLLACVALHAWSLRLLE